MYIIEKLIKLCKRLKHKEQEIIIPNMEDNYELEDIYTCKHTFMPIDSTGETLACSKCGYLISKKELLKMKKK